MNALPGPDGRPPVVGIVGIEGAYGRWFARFFRERLGLQATGSDPALAASPTPRELVERCDVLVFSAPIRTTTAIIGEYVEAAGGIEAGKFWLDLTSIKQAPVDAMLRSRADVAGLHPMAAPPKIGSLKGRALAVCEARVDRWRGWLEHLLQALEAECVPVAPAAHDRAMALVQGLGHATHMTQARVLQALADDAGGLPLLHALRTVGYELDLAVTGRLLSGNPAIYEGIQFDNPHVLPVLRELAEATNRLRDCVADGGDDARSAMRRDFIAQPAAMFDAGDLAMRNHGFERLGYLLADLEERPYLSVYLPEDRPGSLRALLEAFETLGINLASIHSSRTPEGQLHFRIGLDALPVALETVRKAVEDAGIGQVLESGDAAD